MKSFVALFAVLASVAKAQIPMDGVAVVLGGFGGGVSMEVIEENQHCTGDKANPKLPTAPTGSIEGWVAEYVDGKYYVCGGSNINNFADCYAISFGETFWTYSGTLDNAREYGASLVMNGEMYVIGGYNDRDGWLDTVEKKTVGVEEWIHYDDWDMPRKLFNLCAQPIDDTKLMIFGGDEFGNGYIDAVTMLDTTTNTWTEQEPLDFGRASLACLKTTYNGNEGIMVSGGCIEECLTHLSDVAFFDFTTMSFDYSVGNLNEVRMGHKMTHINGRVAAIGGYDSSLKSSIELYDAATNTWELHPSDLEFPRWAFGMPSYIPMSEITCA